MKHLATIGLGANLPSLAGPPERTIVSAMNDLSAAGSLPARSSLYRTEPVDFEGQPAFVNAVAQLETDFEPEPLLQFLLGIERRYGRERDHDLPKGPRTLDLDLLLVDDLSLHRPGLTLPHPALSRRRFVLAPLCEIAPQLLHPTLRVTMAELLAALPEEGPNRADAVRRIAIA